MKAYIIIRDTNNGNIIDIKVITTHEEYRTIRNNLNYATQALKVPYTSIPDNYKKLYNI